MKKKATQEWGIPRESSSSKQSILLATPGSQLIGRGTGVRSCGKPNAGVRRVEYGVKTLTKDQQVSDFLQRKQAWDQHTGNNSRW